MDHGSIEDSDSSSARFSSSVEARLWLLMRSKLIDPFACRGLKSLSTYNKPDIGSHEMLDESLDDARDVMLDGDESPIFDAYGDAMELDEANHRDLFLERSLNGIADEGGTTLDDDLFWEHCQDEVANNRVEILDDNSTSSVHHDSRTKFSGAFAFETENEVVC